MSNRTWHHLALLGLAAFVVASRLLFLTSSTNMWDSCAYIDYVQTMLATGDPLHFDDLETGHPLYLQLGALGVLISHWLGGPTSVAFVFKAVGIALVASSVWPLSWLARWLLRDRTGALLACAFYALIPLLWWWSGEVMSDAAGAVFLVWAFGLVARWADGGGIAWQMAGSFVMGAGVLVRFANTALFPLFGLVVVLIAVRRRAWKSVFGLAWIAVPIAGYLAWELSGRAFAEWGKLVRPTAHVAIDWARTWDPARWFTIGERVTHGLGWAGVTAGGIGLFVAIRRHWGLAAFALAWFALVLFPQLGVHTSFMRYWLPIVPVVAILMAAAVGVLPALGVRRRVTVGATAGVALGLILAAWPDLVTLHERKNALDAVAEWADENTDARSLFVGEMTINHVRVLGHREVLLYVQDFYEWPFLADLGAVTTPGAVLRIDEALAAKRNVYFCELIDPRCRLGLERYYHAQVAGRIDGKNLRNVYDSGFVEMGDEMRRTRDLFVYQLRPREMLPRFIAPPRVTRRAGRLVVDIAHPAFAGLTCLAAISRSAKALDWTEGRGLKDGGPAAGIEVAEDRCELDAKGRGRIEIPVPSDAAAGWYLAVILFDRAIPYRVSIPRRVPEG